ncbi:MAG: hypothetical protein JO022_14010 [Acidobacteriaceae bacterium]|nr:hypothetical protein [Acidobacteriaceae bacterium]
MLDRLYSKSRSQFDPFGPISTPSRAYLAASSSIPDVIIWLAGRPDAALHPRSLATHGVFSVQFGSNNDVIPFWTEVARGETTSTARIFWHDESFLQGRLVRTIESPTAQGLFITENGVVPVFATIRSLASLCVDLQYAPTRFEDCACKLPSRPSTDAAPVHCPSNLEVAAFAIRKLRRSATLRFNSRGKQLRWFAALRPNDGQAITDSASRNLSGFHEVPLPKGVEQMADPFLWEADGKQFLLFEEVSRGQSRGRLGCVELAADGSPSEMGIILDRPYHLSYPCVVPENGELFLLPESADSQRVDLYRFVRFPWELELVASPVTGVMLTDTTPVLIDGLWYFFSTTIEPFMETLLFTSPRLEGPWRLHPANPVSTSIKNSRSAGNLFWKNARLFRPTQDCSVCYGYAITINEVTRLTPTEFQERPVTHLLPDWMPALEGTHTWNESSRWQVIDGLRLVRESGSL